MRSPVFQCSRVHDVGRTLVVFPNKSEAFKLTMNAGFLFVVSSPYKGLLSTVMKVTSEKQPFVCTEQYSIGAPKF
jgi:hypothetical protein